MRLSVPAGARIAAEIRTPAPPALWTLYELPRRPDDSPLWAPFKLMLPPDTPARWRARRAFTVFWNPLDLRLRKDAETRALSIQAPDLQARLELLLSLEYGPEWLVRVVGMTPEAIRAEAGRLATLASERRARKRAAMSPSNP